MTKRTALAFVLLASVSLACRRSSSDGQPAATPGPTPELFADRAAVLDAIEKGRWNEAAATLEKAKGTADVHFLRAKLAVARQDADVAYAEIKKAVEDEPGWPEYQYELGVIAPLPVQGLSDAQLENRLKVAGVALKKAVEMAPNEPRYQYAYAFFLTSAPPHDGGDVAAGKKRFDDLVEKFPGTAWAHRVKFDRAADEGNLDVAEAEAKKVANLDATEGARLFLLAAGSRLIAGELELAKADLEEAAKLRKSAAAGFCDAGYALDGGNHPDWAEPFWTRCLEIDPDGPKAPQARARLGKL